MKMETPEALIQSIKQYESQLAQVKLAISSSSEGTDRDDLISLQSDIEELLHLTKENLDTLNESLKTKEKQNEKPEGNDPYADEYELFKAELAALDNNSDQSATNGNETNNVSDSGSVDDEEEEDDDEDDDDTDIQSELNDLLGSKCQAPYTNRSGGKSYHNALVSAIEMYDSPSDLNDIKVRVLFTNPIEKEMIPCPYFLDNRCNFGESKCKYSHGNVIQLSLLQEYKEPDFKLIKAGCRVLAKSQDSLWKSAVVEDIVSDEMCVIKLEGRFQEVPVYDLLPLSESRENGTDSDLSETEDGRMEDRRMDYKVEMSLTREEPVSRLGDWERYTKGIGSKLMAKMGYVVGCGLGKAGEGRLDPVEATILPVGKSLDHCMNLKEAAGGSKDIFSAERIQRKLALRELKKSKRRYIKDKKQEKHDVFNVINKLSSVPASSSKSNVSSGRSLKKKLASTTRRELNVERLKLAENMRQTERSIYVLKESLTRQKAGTVSHRNLMSKLQSAEGQLVTLQNMDSKVAREQNLRETKRKMTIF